MPIPFTCPHCGTQTIVADEYAGQSGPCAKCGQTITIPAAPGVVDGYAPPAKSGSGTTTLVAVLIGAAVMFVICGGILLALLLPAVQAAREAARRAQCANNLKQIGLAMHNYHSEYNCFPPAYVADKDGKPLYSWRVLLLPYMEQKALYQQFHLDEPWDSPNNRPLANLMPPMYRCPSDPNPNSATTTHYVAITGPGTVFDDAKACRFSDITDGMSNTLLVLETPGTPVNWTEPVDTTIDELTLGMSSNGGRQPHLGGFQSILCDGSYHFISSSIDVETLKRLSEKSDGKPIDAGAW